jgi:hypothetical protein
MKLSAHIPGPVWRGKKLSAFRTLCGTKTHQPWFTVYACFVTCGACLRVEAKKSAR